MLKIYRNIFTIIFSICSLLAYSQVEQSLYFVQTYDNSGQPLQKGTAIILDGQGTGATHQNLFIGATSAKVFTQDSTVHNISTFNAYDPATGLVKFAVDNNLSTKFQKASIKAGNFEEGSSLTLLQSIDIQKTEKKDVKISKSVEIEGYGQFAVIPDNLNKSMIGAAVLSGNAVAGIILNEANGVNGAVIIDLSRLENANSITNGFSNFTQRINVNGHLLSALNAYANEEWPSALNAFEDFANKNPKDDFAWKMAGFSAFEAENYDKTISNLTNAFKIKSNPRAYSIRAFAYFEQKKYTEAINDFAQSQDEKVNEAKWHAYKGISHYELDQLSQAISDLEKAVELKYEDPQVSYYLGNAQFKKEDYNKAITAYDQAEKLGYESELLFNNRGKAKFLMEKYEEAIEYYTT
jgi:tetratricopeptide (TPR) repeat protein